MKKLLFATLTAFLMVLSCTDNKQKSDASVITGSWKKTKFLIISGKDKSVLSDKTEPSDKCRATIFEFKPDKTFILTGYFKENSNCVSDTFMKSTYTYDGKTKTLSLTDTDGNGKKKSESFTVHQPTQNELQLTDIKKSNDDYNHDGIPDTSVLVFNKQ